MNKIDKISSERISVLRFPLIVGVVCIHAYGNEQLLTTGLMDAGSMNFLADTFDIIIAQGIARIAVPLFYLLSGYFVFLGFSWSLINYKEKLRSRARTLLVPHLIWNMSALFILAVAQSYSATQSFLSGKKTMITSFGMHDYLNAIIGLDGPPLLPHFWFIRDLMIMILLVPVVYFVVAKLPKMFLGLMFAVWFMDIWPVYMPSGAAFVFFTAGAYVASSHMSLFAFDRDSKSIFFVYICILLIDAMTKRHAMSTYIHNTGVIIGVISVLNLSKTITNSERVKKHFLWAGDASFFVFAAHLPLLFIIRKAISRNIASVPDVVSLIIYIIMPLVVIILSMILYIILKASAPRTLRLITGGR